MTQARHTSEQIEQIIKDRIAKEFMYDKPDVVLTNDFALIEQGVIDSMGIFRLISMLEEEFSVTINPDEVMLENFATIEAIKNTILNKQ
jgi:acyl carrier protein